ncbi:hypothetical protein [Hymenobacter lapidarius]|uniref:hypothetical protein n=1 Tax=Hymenobacter lapidarius TaxID=1908237 RepID=UPI00130145FC|nr:hypothetical protein [Hymenobacter lapidarius]
MQLSAAACHLLNPHPSKPGQYRGRAAGHAPPAGKYLLLPVAGEPRTFTLLPV